ncbi:MAG: ABC transporter permease [Desulfobacteraceae bacterium]|nr:MAG: ABC transporter permease [Desulfobacteraceae bacterium]
MTHFIIRRLLQNIIVIFLLSFFCYGILNLMPGDPLDIMISSNPKITSADIARLKALYGVDRPLYRKYFSWLGDLLQGDLGYSRTYKVPVGQLIAPRLINTFVLSFSALTLAILIAIPLGILAALKKGTKIDYIINFFAFAGISIPSFWLGIMLMILFAVYLKWLPAGGTSTVEQAQHGLGFLLDRGKYLILPMLSLMAQQMGVFARYARSTMLEVIEEDYIRTARAKGLRYPKIIYVHAFKNALISLITVISISFSYIFSGAIITETIFAYQGVGRLVYDSIMSNDFNVAMISFSITIVMVLAFNLVADILYAIVDPRISYK